MRIRFGITLSQKDRVVRLLPVDRILCAVSLAGLLSAAAGCDITGEYERRFAETLQKSGQRAALDQHLDPGEFDVKDAAGQAVGVRLRIPKAIDANKKELPPTDPLAQPPFVKIPGLGYAFDRPLDIDAEQKQFASTYVYFAAVPKADQKADQVQAPIATAVAAAFPGAAWSDVQVTTPQGTPATYKVIRGEGQQDFSVGGAAQKLDGKFELYFIDGPNHYVLIGFRAAKAAAEKYQWDAAVKASVGTITLSGGVTSGGGAPAAPADGAAPAAPAGGAAPAAPAGAAAPAAPAGGPAMP
jgi:hypothetical protein